MQSLDDELASLFLQLIFIEVITLRVKMVALQDAKIIRTRSGMNQSTTTTLMEEVSIVKLIIQHTIETSWLRKERQVDH